MKMLIIHLKVPQPSLRLKQPVARESHKISRLSGQTQTHRQKQVCRPTL